MEIIVFPEVMERMAQLMNDLSPLETGGILFGTREEGRIAVFHCSGPPDDSKHALGNFERGISLLDEWVNEQETLFDHTYVGEWHSHPFATPEPSFLDIDSHTELAKGFGDTILMMIIAGRDYQWSCSKTVMHPTGEITRYAHFTNEGR